MPTLTLPGELTSLDEIADLVLEQSRIAGLNKHATYQLRLAVDELATNIIVHGYQEHGLIGEVVISADVDDHELTVVLQDTAAPYDPLKRDLEQVEEEFDKPLEERPIGGLGVFFVRQAVHNYRYEYQGGRNRNILIVHRPGVAPVATSASTSAADERNNDNLNYELASVASDLKAATLTSRRTLRRNILALVTALNVVSTIVACGIAYKFQKEGFLHSVDRVLTAAAVSAQHDYGDEFQTRILNANTADDLTVEEELADIRSLSELVDKLNLKYVGALVRKGGKYYYTITSSPQNELADGTYDRTWTEYPDATPQLAQTFDDGKLRVQRHEDKYGLFRSAYVPYSLPGSDKVDYVYIADMGVAYIDDYLHSTLAKTAFAGLVICAVSLWLTWMLANNLAGPLTKLARLIRAVAQHDFRMQPDQRQTLADIAGKSHEEVSEVAYAFSRMEERLQNYFEELERTTAEQERTKSELGIAHDIQMGLLPKELPEVPGCDVFARVIPAKEVGGDLFDIAQMDDGRLLLVIADVSGKGISAGLFMAVAKTLLHVGRAHGSQAHSIVEFLNNQLSAQNDALMFVTMFLALFDPKTGELAYSNAGHNPPYIRRRNGRIEPLKGRHGLALGIQGELTYACDTTQLADGDLLLLYTDGITEAQNAKEALFSERRLEECLQSLPGEEDAAATGKAVIDAVMNFQGAAPQADDITLVALRYTAPVAAATLLVPPVLTL